MLAVSGTGCRGIVRVAVAPASAGVLRLARAASTLPVAWAALTSMPEVVDARRDGVPGRTVATSPATRCAAADRVVQIVAAVPDPSYPLLGAMHRAAVCESAAAWPPATVAVPATAVGAGGDRHWLAREADLANARALWHSGGRLTAVADATARAIGHLAVTGRPPVYLPLTGGSGSSKEHSLAAIADGLGAALVDARLLALHALVWPWAPGRDGSAVTCAEFQSAAGALAAALAHTVAAVDNMASLSPADARGGIAWAKAAACCQVQVRLAAAVARHHGAAAAAMVAAVQGDEAAGDQWRGLAMQLAASAVTAIDDVRALWATLRTAPTDSGLVAGTATDVLRAEGAVLALDAHLKLVAGLHLAAPALASTARPVTSGPVWESATPLFPLPRLQQEELAPAVRSAGAAATASLKATDALPADGGRWGDLGRPIAPPPTLTLRTVAALQFASGRAVVAEGLLSSAISAATDAQWWDVSTSRPARPPPQLPSSTVAVRLCAGGMPLALASNGIGLGSALGFLLRQWDRRETAGHRELHSAADADAAVRLAMGLTADPTQHAAHQPSWRTAPSLLHSYLRSQSVCAPVDAACCTVGSVGMAWPHALLDAAVDAGSGR